MLGSKEWKKLNGNGLKLTFAEGRQLEAAYVSDITAK
jgi:hypothetical protein